MLNGDDQDGDAPMCGSNALLASRCCDTDDDDNDDDNDDDGAAVSSSIPRPVSGLRVVLAQQAADAMRAAPLRLLQQANSHALPHPRGQWTAAPLPTGRGTGTAAAGRRMVDDDDADGAEVADTPSRSPVASSAAAAAPLPRFLAPATQHRFGGAGRSDPPSRGGIAFPRGMGDDGDDDVAGMSGTARGGSGWGQSMALIPHPLAASSTTTAPRLPFAFR